MRRLLESGAMRACLVTLMGLRLCLSSIAPATAAPEDVVVMIHGAGGGGWEYDRWRPVFVRAGWSVIAPDLQPVKAGLAATTFADYVRQVRAWVPRERRRLALVGASLGGILALKAAESLHPDAVVLVNSVPPAGVGASRARKRYPEIVRWANGPLQETRDAMPDSDEATILWAHPRWRDESGAVLNAVAQGIAVRKPACPTLVVLGERDTDIPPATGLALARWAGADVQLYAATSHVGPLLGRRAEEIAAAVRQWVEASLARREKP
ncbi:MAG TPA: alpha/beta fold hydrolase [Chthonomonadaceae bacterium]|nr:alpha/beta fold hydrolase [Chthonomonadaceae bacterium]